MRVPRLLLLAAADHLLDACARGAEIGVLVLVR